MFGVQPVDRGLEPVVSAPGCRSQVRSCVDHSLTWARAYVADGAEPDGPGACAPCSGRFVGWRSWISTEQSAIVTGGASGIGAATARKLADRGRHGRGRRPAGRQGEALAKEIGGTFVADVTKTESRSRTRSTPPCSLALLRALVNSAGIGWAQRTIGKDGEFASAHNPRRLSKKVLEINLVGTFGCIRLAATAMSRLDLTDTGERGAIVNMTSVAAADGQIGHRVPSSGRRGGLTTLPVAPRPVGRRRVRVNTVAPGLIDTPTHGRGRGVGRSGQAR